MTRRQWAEKRQAKKRKRKPKYIIGPPIQLHHAEYVPQSGECVGETVGHLFKGEHSIVTSLRRQTRNVSKWFIECLTAWINEAHDFDERGLRSFRDLNDEITELPEGQSYHCKWCGKGFLVKKNVEKHQPICRSKKDEEPFPREEV